MVKGFDAFCGAGGATRGYQNAGFEMWGCDIASQSHYIGERFFQEDALAMLADREFLAQFAFIHASPPCQRYSNSVTKNRNARSNHPDLIAPVRELILASGLPYVIENVEGARIELREPSLLCGSHFGLKIRRHRLFETNFFLLMPACQHGVEDFYEKRFLTTTRANGRDKGKKLLGGIVNAAATGARWNISALRREMEVPWMLLDREVTESIPPAYTEFIGEQLMAHVLADRAAAQSGNLR